MYSRSGECQDLGAVTPFKAKIGDQLQTKNLRLDGAVTCNIGLYGLYYCVDYVILIK